MLGLTVLGTVLTLVPAAAALLVAKKKRRGMFRWFWIALLSPFAFHLLLWINIGAMNVAAWMSLNPFDMTGWLARQLEGFATSFLASLVGLCFPTGLLIRLWRTEEFEEMEVVPAGKVKQVLGWTSVGLVGSLYAILLLGTIDLPRMDVPSEKVPVLASTPTPNTDVNITNLVVDTKPEHDPKLQEALELVETVEATRMAPFLVATMAGRVFVFGETQSGFSTLRGHNDSGVPITFVREDLRNESIEVLATLIAYELAFLSAVETDEGGIIDSLTHEVCMAGMVLANTTAAKVWSEIGTGEPQTEMERAYNSIHQAWLEGFLTEAVLELYENDCTAMVELVG